LERFGEVPFPMIRKSKQRRARRYGDEVMRLGSNELTKEVEGPGGEEVDVSQPTIAWNVYLVNT
jgi:hypothetical protein